jgi:hypothetical protein
MPPPRVAPTAPTQEAVPVAGGPHTGQQIKTASSLSVGYIRTQLLAGREERVEEIAKQRPTAYRDRVGCRIYRNIAESGQVYQETLLQIAQGTAEPMGPALS